MYSKLNKIINEQFVKWICEQYEEQLTADNQQEVKYESGQIQLEREKLQEVAKQMQLSLTDCLEKMSSDFMDSEYSILEIKEEKCYSSQYENQIYEAKQLLSIEDNKPQSTQSILDIKEEKCCSSQYENQIYGAKQLLSIEDNKPQTNQAVELGAEPGEHTLKNETESDDEEFIVIPEVSSENSLMQPECSKKTKKPDESRFSYLASLRQVENHFICIQCPVSIKYTTMRSVAYHIKRAHLGFRFQCKQCRYGCSRPNFLKKHMKEKHGIVETPKHSSKKVDKKHYNYEGTIKKMENHFICTLCPVSINYRHITTIKEHIKRAHFGFRYNCKQCAYNCSRLFNYKNHLKNVHNVTEQKEKFTKYYKKIDNAFNCTMCTVKYMSHACIVEHIRTIHFGFQYECENCDAELNTRQKLQTHQKYCMANIN